VSVTHTVVVFQKMEEKCQTVWIRKSDQCRLCYQVIAEPQRSGISVYHWTSSNRTSTQS